jgi:serine protease AprX
MVLMILPLLSSSGEIFEKQGNFQIMDGVLIEELSRADPDDDLEVIIQFKNEIKNRDLMVLNGLGFDVKRTFHVIPAVFAVGSKASIIKLSANDRVFHIEFNMQLEYLMDESTTTINATTVWASMVIDHDNRTRIDRDGTPLHIDGEGVTVVVVDSGIDAGHPDLDYGTKTIMNLKSDMDGTYTEAENTDTSSGHGTHCSGTIAGNGDASGGARRGVAPKANLIGISTGEAVAILNALGALEWVYDHSRPNANYHNIRACSNSWGSNADYNADNAINQVTRRIVNDNNVAVIFAAGNAGADNHDGSVVTTNPYSLEPAVISVAAIARDGSGIASFSSRGAANDNFTWPDIGAPGVSIWATEARKTLISAMRKQDPDDAMDGYYMAISGTSMATPHVSGLAALIFQACPDLKMSDLHDDFQDLEYTEYWENEDYRMHEVEMIMKLSATYILPAADNGVPNNYSIGLNFQPNDYAQGYGNVHAQKAVALALTLQELRRTDRDATVMDAYYVYHNITTTGTSIEKTDVLATSWKGDWSQFTDPENPVSSFTTSHPRAVYIHNQTSKLIIDLEYDPVSTSELYMGSLTVVIDYNGDGNIDWRGESAFSTEGIRHEVIEVAGGGGETGQLWEFNVEGSAIWAGLPTGTVLGENEFNEAVIEYTLSVQMVFAISEDETIYYDSGDMHAKIAQPEFGEPTMEYAGNGSIEMKAYYFDLTKAYPGEAPKTSKVSESGFPWWVLIIAVIAAALLGYYAWDRNKKMTKKGKVAEVEALPVQSTQQPQFAQEIVEAEVVAVPQAEPGSTNP